MDNNLSQRLSLRDPLAVAQIKSAGAGLTTISIALLTGHAFPPARFVAGSVVMGGLSYGASLVCVMLALRYLGAAREAAWFATAPFVGAALSIPIFHVMPTAAERAGMVSMIAGVFVLVRERHGHLHTHEILEHDHAHFHDQHPTHDHDALAVEPHAHPHRHGALTHEHLHVSDLHHRHRHG